MVRRQDVICITTSPSSLEEEESKASEAGESNNTSNDTCREPINISRTLQ